MEFTGKVKYISPLQTGTSKNGNEWQKLEAVIEETTGQYPQSIVVTQFGNTVDEHRLIEGRIVKAHIGFKVNEYNGKYYNAVNCYKVENIDNGPSPTQNAQYQPQAQPTVYAQPPVSDSGSQADDLPF